MDLMAEEQKRVEQWREQLRSDIESKEKEYKAWKEKPLPEIPTPTINQPAVKTPDPINVPVKTITNIIEEIDPKSPDAPGTPETTEEAAPDQA